MSCRECPCPLTEHDEDHPGLCCDCFDSEILERDISDTCCITHITLSPEAFMALGQAIDSPPRDLPRLRAFLGSDE